MCKFRFRYLVILILILASQTLLGQTPLKINKLVSPNQITSYSGQGLILLDFWATWCAPCVPATKQLEILQAKHKNDLFIVSITEEEENIIAKFLQKNPIKLAVIKDLYGNLIKDFKIYRRPHAVLINTEGKILYEGHPANITDAMVDKYSAQNRTTPNIKWEHIFTTIANTNQVNKEFTIARNNDLTQNQYSENGIFHYAGSLSGLIKYLTGYSYYQLDFDYVPDFGITMSCPEEELSNTTLLLNTIADKLSIRLQKGQTIMNLTTLNPTTPSQLWGQNQIEWNNGSAHNYIISVDRIEADNMSLSQIAGLLSDIKGRPYFYKGQDKTPYDWNFHYLYDNLLREDLEQNFGIKLKDEKLVMPAYIVMPK